MSKLPRPLAEAITASLQSVMPAGVTLQVSNRGGYLLSDGYGFTADSVFQSVLYPLLGKRMALRDSASCAMESALDAAQRPERRWPAGIDSRPTPHLEIAAGVLRMSYVSNDRPVIECPPVRLPEGWR